MASKKSQRVINAETDVIGLLLPDFSCHFETGENPFAVIRRLLFSGIKIELRRMTEKKCRKKVSR
jgi:hypothetical protein